jgi:hypothetical protein
MERRAPCLIPHTFQLIGLAAASVASGSRKCRDPLDSSSGENGPRNCESCFACQRSIILTAVPSKAASVRMGQWKAEPSPIPIIAVALTIAGGRSASLIKASQCMKYGCVFHCFLRPIRWCSIKLAVVMTVQLHSFYRRWPRLSTQRRRRSPAALG